MIALLRLIAIGAVAISAAAQARPADDMPLIAAAIRSGRLVQAELMLARMTPPAIRANSTRHAPSYALW